MAKTPSGLSVSEAEALSKQYKLPDKNKIFKVKGSGGQPQLGYTDPEGRLFWLTNKPEGTGDEKWQGKTQAQWRQEGTQQFLKGAGLNLEDIPEANMADLTRRLGKMWAGPGMDRNQAWHNVPTSKLNPDEFAKTVGGEVIRPEQASAYNAPSQISPDQPMAPENDLQGVRQVFGQDWQPAPIFQERGLIDKGIYGAVRVAGSPNVFTIGPGGRLETPESFQRKFGISEQEGIVDEISPEQAQALGITQEAISQPPTPADEPTVDDLTEDEEEIIIPPAGSGGSGGDDADTIASSADAVIKSIQDYIDMLTPPETDTSKRLDDLISDLEENLEDRQDKGAAQLEEEEEYGVQEKRNSLTAIQSKIQTRMAEFNQVQAQLQQLSTEIENKPITMSSIVGSQSAIQNKLIAKKNSFAADMALLEAQALGIQGQLTNAQNAADRSVELKYTDIEDRINTQTTLIGLLEGQLSKDEQIRSNAINLYLQDRQQAISDQKSLEKQIQDIMISAAEAGASQETLNRISKTTTIEDAIGYAYQQSGDGDGIGDGKSEFKLAIEYAKEQINKNPDISDDMLLGDIRSDSDLGITEVRSAISEARKLTDPEVYSERWFESKVKKSKEAGMSVDQIIDFLEENFDTKQLYQVARDKGFASWYKPKSSEFKDYIESLM